MRTLLQDMRYGTRMLTHSPGFTFAAVICLALGIGGTTAIFSIVYAVLMRPLPYAHPDQLVRVYTEFPTFPNGGLRRFWTSPPEFLDLRKYTHSWQWHSRQSASRNYGKASRQETAAAPPGNFGSLPTIRIISRYAEVSGNASGFDRVNVRRS